MKNLNIIIPIGGLGKRFSDEGYSQPKPMVNVMGKPIIFWLLDNLRINKNDNIFIVYQKKLDNHGFSEKIKNRYRNTNITFIKINHNTRGACDTINLALNHCSFDLSLPIVSLDCDTFYTDDILTMFRKYSDNLILYSTNTDDKPLFSYIKTENDILTDIVEKVKISDNINIGSYGFKNGHILKKYTEKLLISDSDTEIYISEIYKNMLSDGVIVKSKLINGFQCLGTPNQVKVFVKNNINTGEKFRFCFDLDNTLVTFPEVYGDYTTVKPMENNIKFLRLLKKLNHHIIIHTARRMRTHDGDVNAVINDVGDITVKTLKDFNIPYDEIIFGKPYAHFYIDDLSINTYSDLEYETGFYDIDIPTRRFNDLSIFKDYVIKKTNNKCESFWYLNSPNTDIIPKFEVLDDQTIKLERINGIPLSYYMVKEEMSVEILNKLLGTIFSLHNTEVIGNYDYSFYEKKLIERVLTYNFNDLPNFTKNYSKLYNLIKNYSLSTNNFNIIHGDPVFSNILLDLNYNLKFIDMRGSFGNGCSLYGDKYYDYAKIYQSLCGYDNIMLGKEINTLYSKDIKKHFESFFDEKEVYNIKLITAYLFLTLIPLHDDILKIKQYYNIFSEILDEL